MSVHVISRFPTHAVLSAGLGGGEVASSYSDGSVSASGVTANVSGRPATVALDPLGCMRGLAWALAFEASVVLAGFGVWELWRVIR
jgi:hypothetical protein